MQSYSAYVLVAILACCAEARAATRYVSLSGGHAPPFTDWSLASTNIQIAIDASSAGDLILVSNGVYWIGGKVMAGTLTNRVALDKAITVQSLNGPAVTTILGFNLQSRDQVRCAWLTNGAALNGFWLRFGATLTASDFTLGAGGGVWCAGPGAIVTNCIIDGNRASLAGAGVYGGTVRNCDIRGNFLTSGSGPNSGGAAYGCVLNNCAVGYNSSFSSVVAGTSYCIATNCTIAYNSSNFGSGGSSHDQLYNCIVYFNNNSIGSGNQNYASSTLQYCCSTPLPAGTANITGDPQFGFGLHLTATSPCRTKGNASFVAGTDLDGQPWANPPSIGCDEWRPEPVITPWSIIGPGTKVGEASLLVNLVGQEPMTSWWTKDGLPIDDGPHYSNARSTNLLVRAFGLDDAGLYQVVASNSFGVTTGQVFQPTVHCVDASSPTPSPPYTNWPNAATSIQDAINAAVPGDVVVVTNGVYASGGRFDGLIAVRVSVSGNAPSLILSINGPESTIIEGQRASPDTNAPPAVSCVSLGGGLSGFTLRNGEATNTFLGAGGVLGSGTVAFCILTNNASSTYGGAGYGVRFINCILANNSARYGGATYSCTLYNCLITGNSALSRGGGCDSSTLNNCTVTFNSGPSPSAGVSSSKLTNSIVYFNFDPISGSTATNHTSSVLQNCCSTPLPAGIANISNDPQLVDAFHLGSDSPCRGAGSIPAATGTDLDGQSWASPPSIGCDEVFPADFGGALEVSIAAPWTEVGAGGRLPLTGKVTGRASRLEWSFGDGPAVANASYLASHSWTNPGDYLVTFTAFNSDNPAGVSTNLSVHVAPLIAPLLTGMVRTPTNFSLQFAGQAGVTYIVERTANLAQPIAWQIVQTYFSAGGPVQARDAGATNAALFYRVRTQ